MKKTILGFALLAATTIAHGQGSIQFRNPVIVTLRVTMVDSSGNSTFAPTSIPINYGVFFGSTAESVSLSPVLPLGTTHPTLPGIIDASTSYLLPGTQGGETVFLRVRGWSAEFGTDWQRASVNSGSWFGETEIRPFTLGPTQGPGTVIWTAAHPETGRLLPLVLHQVPEPSTFVLGALGGLLLFLRHRNSTSK